jgi:hypothetical protein
MKEIFKAWSDAQQHIWSAWLPADPTPPEAHGKPSSPPFVESFNELRDVWKESIEQFSALSQRLGGAAQLRPQSMQEMFSPSKWAGQGIDALDANLRQIIEGPQYATLWDLDRKAAELQQLGVQRSKDIAAYQSVIQAAWKRAYELFAKQYGDLTATPPTTWRELTNRWLKIANDVLIETYRSDAFLEAQRRVLRTASDYRLKEQEIAHAFCEANHIPTRHEIDEMQRTVAELRRQVRTLTRTFSATTAASSEKKPKFGSKNVEEAA